MVCGFIFYSNHRERGNTENPTYLDTGKNDVFAGRSCSFIRLAVVVMQVVVRSAVHHDIAVCCETYYIL